MNEVKLNQKIAECSKNRSAKKSRYDKKEKREESRNDKREEKKEERGVGVDKCAAVSQSIEVQSTCTVCTRIWSRAEGKGEEQMGMEG